MDDSDIDEKEKQRLLRERLDVDDVMSTESGRRFMWRILSYCGVYRDIDGKSIDVYKALGNRQTGLYIMGVLSDVCEEKVFTMMREARNLKILEDGYEHNNDRSSHPYNAPASSTSDASGDDTDLDKWFDTIDRRSGAIESFTNEERGRHVSDALDSFI